MSPYTVYLYTVELMQSIQGEIQVSCEKPRKKLERECRKLVKRKGLAQEFFAGSGFWRGTIINAFKGARL